MELLLNDQQILLRDAAAKLGAARGGPRRARLLRDSKREIDTEAWAEIVDAGWLSALVSEAHDGLGLGLYDLALALEETGKQVLMTPLIETAAATWALSETASGAALAEGKRVIPAITVPGQAYSGQATGLRFEAGALSGTVPFVAFAAQADAFLVTAGAGDTAVLCLVPRDAAGLSMTATVHVDGSTSSALGFAGVKVTADGVVARGAAAAAIAGKLQDMLVLGTAAELLGVAEAATALTLDYIKLRQQFGKQIGSFQALQHRIVNCYVDAELNRSLLYNVLSAWDAGTSHPAMIAAAKARIGRGALQAVRVALQMHGAIGYTDEHDIGIFYKRAVALAAKYGNEITQTGRFSELTQSSH